MINKIFDLHNVGMFVMVGMLLTLTSWMQFSLLEDPEAEEEEVAVNDPDYYVEYFTSYGVDVSGKQYQLEADRLVHYPLDNKALLDRPHLVQTDPEGTPMHIYADSGWLFSDGDEILLTENVKVIRGKGKGLGGAATTDRMRIKLKPETK